MLQRPRRLRTSAQLRKLVEETQLSVDKLIFPLFVCEGKGVKKIHPHIQGALTLSLDELIKSVEHAYATGLRSFLLFGVCSKKDEKGSEALNPDSVVVQAIQLLRDKFSDIVIATDIALDPYTDHGHDGLYRDGKVLNDETVEVLTQMAVLHAKSGAQIVSPSDMMDGRVRGIREGLENAKLTDTLILSYTAKYASCLYGPFRDILSAEVKGDKKSYQMNPANRREALKELQLDLEEGADMMMVKPASWYLDIISDFKRESNIPIAAYQVSAECAMVELAARAGIFSRDRAIVESATSIVRAGADILVTYFAVDLARTLA